MWQRFTERARRVVFFAQEEAGRLGENEVSTEHLLLGLVRENDCVAARILHRLGIDLKQIRSEVERQVTLGYQPLGRDMQLSATAKRVIDLAYDEARQLNNNYIGTEHVLLGLIREEGGLAGQVLKGLGAELERTRAEVVALQAENKGGGEPANEADRLVAIGQSGLLNHARQLVAALLKADTGLAALGEEQLGRILLGRAEPPDAPEPPQHTEQVFTGDLGTLRAEEGRERVEMAGTTNDFQALVDAYVAKDAYGYRELTADSEHAAARVLMLKAGTAVKSLTPPGETPIGVGRRALYVRVLNGTFAGKTGWVSREAFERTGPDTAPFPPAAE